VKPRPFKKFFCDRPEVFLLPPAAFKIWMYHYAREGQVRQSWAKLETLCDKLNMDRHSVCKWRGWLIENGWLEKVGERQSSSGKFSVPIFKVRRGTVPEKITDGRASNRVRKLRTRTGVKTSHTDRCENFALEVDKEKQVDYVAPCLAVAREMRKGRLAGTSQKAPVSLVGKIETED
jgi:Helix-turn-helix domain